MSWAARSPSRLYEIVAGENGDTPEQVREMVNSFNEILRSYADRDWEGAFRLVEKHSGAFPEDSVAAVYLERCRTFRESPPPRDWDGVYELTAK